LAPAWFAPAMQIALLPVWQKIDALSASIHVLSASIHVLSASIDVLSGTVNNLAILVQNNSASIDDDDIVPPTRNHPVPIDFPTNVGALRNLSLGPLMISLENYYGLSHHGSLATRRKRIKRVYGLGLTVSP
jgi:hypothetical protein